MSRVIATRTDARFGIFASLYYAMMLRRFVIFLEGKRGRGLVTAGFGFLGALCHDGSVEALAELGGDLVDLMVFVDRDGLAGGVEYDLAVAAGGGVGADLFEELRADVAVKIISKLREEIGAGHTV
jgi:hypothetical protein